MRVSRTRGRPGCRRVWCVGAQRHGLWAVDAGGKVYTLIVPTTHPDSRLPTIRQTVYSDSLVYTDALRAYNALYVSDFHPLRKFNGIKPENIYWVFKGVRVALQW